MNKILNVLFGLPKSLFINFYCFDLKTALHFPVIVGRKTSLIGLRRESFQITKPVHFAMVTIGIWTGSDFMGKGSRTSVEFSPNAKFIINGRVSIASGTHIFLDNNAMLKIGDGFKGNYGLHIVCREEIEIKNDVLISWNCTIMDSDGHEIINESREVINVNKRIVIGNHIWIGADVFIFKGVEIADNSVISGRSTLRKNCPQSNCIYSSTGREINMIRENIDWNI